MKHPPKFDEIFYKVVLLAISIALLIFLAERAAKAAFTFDEAATYLNYISASPMAIFNFNSANNHLVNTLLTKLAWTLGGSSEFVLRLPSLLAFVAYLLFSFLILSRFIKNKIAVVCGFLLLSVNPYVLDFFSLCRGYGLSLAFLMAALFFFFSFIDKSIENKASGDRRLYFSLASAALAVLCNFSLLNVYLGLAILAFVLFAVWNRQDRRQAPLPTEPFPKHPRKKKLLLPVLVLLAVLFNILVISQDLTLAEKFFEPVVVRITGPNEQEKQSLGVFRIDVKNQETRLIYEGDLWRMDKPAYFTAIKFRCLPDVMNKIKHIEIRIGFQKFAFDADGLKRFKNFHQKRYSVFYSNYSVSLKRSLFPIFRPVINWKGDSAFLPYFLLRMLIVLGILAVALVLFSILGRVLERWKILARDQFRPFISTTLLLAAFIGYPLYILKRSGELYWGGQTGFIRDTVFSLINNSFYGNLYFRRQEWVIFLAVCLFLLAFLVVAFIHYRRKTLAKILPGLSLLAVLFFCSISTILQRALLHNPYLIGRTALFFIPVFMLLLLFLFRDLSRGTKGLKIVSLSLLALMAVLSVYHFTERANTAMTVEWRSDADTKTLLEDLTSFKEKDFAHDSKISLGIDDIFDPSLQYYLKRKFLDWLEVNVIPPYQENDFSYLEDAFDSTRAVLPRVVILKAYPLSGNLLVKPKPE